MSIAGKIALVTGGAQGIGYSISERLAQEGASVIIADLNEERAANSAEKIRSQDRNCQSISMDVSDSSDITEKINEIQKDKGSIQILINNAGVYKSTPLDDPNSTANWQLCLDVMLTGSYLVAKAVAPAMKSLNWGRIVNLGSLMSHNAFGEDTAYCAAKTGMLGLTRSLSAELARHNVTVNTVCPGNILTEMLRATGKAIEKRDGLEPDSWLKNRGEAIPMGRLGYPEDIAKAVYFFCSENADYITGQTLHVNGGQYYL